MEPYGLLRDGRAHQRPYAGQLRDPAGDAGFLGEPGYGKIAVFQRTIATMAERSRTRRNTLERRCLPKTFKRMFVGAPKGIFKMLEKIKKN